MELSELDGLTEALGEILALILLEGLTEDEGDMLALIELDGERLLLGLCDDEGTTTGAYRSRW